MTEDLGRKLKRAAAAAAGPAPVPDIVARGGRLARRRRIGAAIGGALAILIVAAATTALVQRGASNSVVHVTGRPGPTNPPASPTTVPVTTVVPTTTSTTSAGFVVHSIPAVPGDVDGDGMPDNVTITWNNTTATVVAHLTRLGDQTLDVPVGAYLLSPQAVERPAILGVIDVDRDGYGEILVQTDHGASTVIFTILKLANGRLTQMSLNGQAVALQVTGSVGHPAIIGCGTGQVVQILLSGNPGSAGFDTYDGERDVYALRGARLELVSKTTHTFANHGLPPTDTQLAAVGWLGHCPPLD